MIITKDSFRDESIRRNIANLFGRELVDKRKSRWQKEVQRYGERIKEIGEQYPKYTRIIRIAEELAYVPLRNHFSDYFYEFYAPLFFKNFPKGQIWFFPFDRKAVEHVNLAMMRVSRKHKVSHEPIFGQAQGMAIDFENTIGITGLQLPLLPRFPSLHGYCTYTENGIFYFLLQRPINILHVDDINLREKLFFDTGMYFTDVNATPLQSSHTHWGGSLNTQDYHEYLQWYVDNINNLFRFLMPIRDPQIMTLASLSIARICLDTYLLQTIDHSYLRKIIFFNLLDKYANLVAFLVHGDNASSQIEFEIWKRLLSFTEFDSRIKPLLKLTPKSLQLISQSEYILNDMIRMMLREKYHKRIKPKSRLPEVLEYLRNYRNSLHGYLLNSSAKRRSFLKHNGEIPNYLPDYAFNLWHAFIASPELFVKNLS